VGHTAQTIQETGHAAPPAPVVSLRTQSTLPPAWAAQVRGILTRSTGYDHLLAYRQATGAACPACGYLPLYCVRAVAEQAMLLWTALLRRLPRQIEQFDSFHRDHLSGRENPGKVMALFGVGNIGHEIAKHRDRPRPRRARRGSRPAPSRRGLCRTRGRAGRRRHHRVRDEPHPQEPRLLQLHPARANQRKPILVNIARGEFTPALALEAALEAGLLSGVALDVYNEESTLAPALRTGNRSALTPDNHALLRLRGRADVLLTPHNSFNTLEAVERKSEQSIRALLHHRQTGQFPWPLPAE
jgi:D-lactate dehydrogenase